MDLWNSDRTELRAKIEEEIQKRHTQRIPAYTKTQALKIFKRSGTLFATPKFDELLLEAVPLITAGFVREKVEKYSHEEMLQKAQDMLSGVDEVALAEGFIYGAVHKDCREYMLPFVAYYFLKNFPYHKKTLYTDAEGKTLDCCCGVCGYTDNTPMKKGGREGAYYQFFDAFLDAEFLYHAKTYVSYPVSHALYCLEEGLRFPKVQPTQEDFERFISAVRLAETIPPDKKVGAYKQVLHRSKILPLTADETQDFINVLSYLNILHPKGMFGFAEIYTPPRERKDPNEPRNDYEYSVCHWKGEDGVDYKMIEKLFGKLSCYQLSFQ